MAAEPTSRPATSVAPPMSTPLPPSSNPLSTVLPPPLPSRDAMQSGNHDTHAAPNLPEREWETSPVFLTLSNRIAKTEQTLSSLSNQVQSLALSVKQLQQSLHAPGANSTTLQPPVARTPGLSAPPVFSPFEGPDPKSPFLPTAPSGALPTNGPSSNSDSTVAALTTQIAALSASVAQLQRLQQNQSHLSRQNSHTTLPPHPSGPFGRAPHDHAGQTPAHVGLGQNHGPGSAGLTPGGFGSNRPRIDRSMSSGVLPGGMDGSDKWGAPTPGSKFTGHQNQLNNGARDWSPGPGGLGQGPMTPSVVAPGANGNGVGAPGAGIVVTKWEHLNLKVDLLRSIAKYGIGPPNKIQARVLPFMLKSSDIIAQAPPTQERIIAYVIPALQLCLTLPPTNAAYRGPTVVIITTTVDQATQCHKLVRSVGGPLGVRAALAAGAAGSSSLANEIAQMQRDAVQLLIGTPAKVAEVISPRGLNGSEVRLLILDEVDQLIARNLFEHVLTVTKLLPAPRRTGANNSVTGPLTPSSALASFSPGAPIGVTSPYDPGLNSPFNPASKTPFPGQTQAPPGPSRFGAPGAPPPSTPLPAGGNTVERQTCIFSNTIPTDVINFSQQLQVRDPVRVLVRREGGVNSQESVSSVTPGINLKHTYVYLTITPSARSEAPAQSDAGPGTIGSGRQNANGGVNEEVTKAKEYKLDMLVKILDDYPLWQAVIHVGTYSMLEAVVYKLGSRQWETLCLAPDMPPPQKKAILQQWRLSLAGNGPRFLVIFDVNVKPPEIPWAPLVINFDLPRSVEGYAHRAAAAVPPAAASRSGGGQVNGVIVSFVQAAGGDVEMLRSTECAYRFKSAEIPTVFHDLFQH